MKKTFLSIATLMMAFCSIALVSCGSDDDSTSSKTEQETKTISSSEWQSKLLGTWKYTVTNQEGGYTSSSATTTYGGQTSSSTEKYKTVKNDSRTLTLGSSDGTYTRDYSCVTTAQSTGTSTTDTTKRNISFTYTYNPDETGFGYKAYLKCTVTKADDNTDYKVGDTFSIYIGSMTVSTVSLFLGIEDETFVGAKDYTRQ